MDDLVVTASTSSKTSVRLEIAARRRPSFIRSDRTTGKLVAALVRADLAAENDEDPLTECRLAVAVSGNQTHAQEIADLAAVARGQSKADEFVELIRTPGKFATRRRLDHLIDMVAAALREIADGDAGSPEYRCWSLLRRLWILQVRLEVGHEDEWTQLIADLKAVALESSVDAAVALRDRLEQISADLARNAGVVDAASLRRRLHGSIRPDGHVPPLGWARLVALDDQARLAVARSLTEDGPTALKLRRRAIREELAAAVHADGDLIVRGDSGVGKSALVMDATEPSALGERGQAIALNLRHVPTSQLELSELLADPLADLLSELTAPDRMLIIDSAEAAAEGHGAVFSHLLRSAQAAGVKVIAVAETEGAGVVTKLMMSPPRELVVFGLDDDELAAVAAHIPALQRLVDNTRARELLRRPIVIDLLARANDPGLPLSEAQALDHIWHHLVRESNGQRTGGAPQAREEVMLQLAAHAVRKGDADGLMARLDHTAVEGLRKSGLLLPAGRQPWGRAPAFKHDLLRAYSVARWLLAERDPVTSLRAIGPPRWTLASARLACEIVLSAPDEPAYPRVSRFSCLQAGFDAIAKAGSGERWSDVPTEALLAVPDGADLLKGAWPALLENEANGVARLIRVLRNRHQSRGVLDSTIAEPVIAELLATGAPGPLADEVAELIRDWLRAHVWLATPAGQPTRITLRDTVVTRCAEAERVLDELEAARIAELAARTPEQIAAEERRGELAFLSGSFTSRGRRRPEPTRHPPHQWIRDVDVEHLALLGLDLGPEGEAILRRIAEDEPHSLDSAVEGISAGQSLASYDPKLLVDLAAAYYIEDGADADGDGDGFGWSGGIDYDGIRRHKLRGFGSPLASFTHGPFLALFRADFRGGVALLNRMLEHAARRRVRTLLDPRFGFPAQGERPKTNWVLSITGEPREYVGDSHVWLWYRGTGVGPFPCMSALQALEFVAEEHIRTGVPPHALTTIMLEDAHNLAMPALALGVLVRHLEIAGKAIDPYLVEPIVWQLEFSRAVNDQTSGLAAQLPQLPNPERREWSLRDVAMLLTLRARDERIAQLKALGEQLLAKAAAEAHNDSPAGAREHLANVRNWASSLDRAAYEAREEDNRILIQQVVDPEVEQVLRNTNADLRRANAATGLTVRHAHVRDNGRRAPAIGSEALAADIDLARQLLDDPPKSVSFSADGPVAAAASAVELHLSGRTLVSEDDLAWSANVLLQIAAGVAQHSDDLFDDSFFNQGSDRSAARSLPYLLLPAASGLRAAALGIEAPGDLDELIEMNRAVLVLGANEARLAYARALDAVWDTPCDTAHLHGRCHHRIAIDLVTESFLDSVIGPWDPDTQRRSVIRLDPPEAGSLDDLQGDGIYGRRLTPALRAMGAAAISSACCRQDARTALRSLLNAHQRAMLAHQHGYHDSQSDSLVAARAALWQAIDNHDDVVLDYVHNYVTNPRVLAEGLQAIAAAAEEQEEAGQQALRLWPRIMDLVLSAAENEPGLFTDRRWGNYAEASLIPNPAAAWGYLTIEQGRQPYHWRDLLSWAPQVDRWLRVIESSRMSIDHLVIAVGELDVEHQLEQGLRWIEQIVAQSSDRASTFTLPEWLHERRADLARTNQTNEDQTARWQRVVDLLVVAGDSRVADLAD